MTLKKLFSFLALGFIVLELTMVVISGWIMLDMNRHHNDESTYTDFDRIYKTTFHELIGNLMIEHKDLTQTFLKQLSIKENITLTVQSEKGYPITEGRTDIKDLMSKSYPLYYSGKNYGMLTIARPRSPLLTGVRVITLYFILGQALLVLGLVGILYWVSRRFVIRPVEFIVESARSGSFSETRDHSRWLTTDLKNLFDILAALWKDYQVQAGEASLGKLSSQVAHDIRSPLSALRLIVNSTKDLPEEQRVIIRSAVSRIEDIANTLLLQYRSVNQETQNSAASGVHLLSGLIESLITEKRIQYRRLGQITIEFELEAGSYGLFAKVEVIEFKRVLSNLINNAVESIQGHGKVTVSLSAAGTNALLQVRDTGRGISPALLEKLGREKISHGKEEGSGLGLHHAYQMVANWGGNVEINSSDKGTSVLISLQKEPAPNWFVANLMLAPHTVVAIIDDDTTVHQLWEERLLKNGVKNIAHLYHPNDLREWEKNKPTGLNVTYLCDYEFVGDQDNGLDLIQELHIENYSILITSRFEEAGLREKCESFGVRMIPKPLAPVVPIIWASFKPETDTVLIDDDPLMHKIWNLSANQKSKTLSCFKSVEEFLRASHLFRPEVAIYVDCHLGEGIRGDKESKRIYQRGFKQIWLATGSSKSEFEQSDWIVDVIGKDPPWNS